MTNGGYSQSIALRVAATSLSPSAAPCALSVPCLLGAPLPMIVLQQISDGFAFGCSDCVSAELIAASTASTSLPSTCEITFQPYASKRFGVSSVNQCFVSPSIEIPLSS